MKLPVPLFTLDKKGRVNEPSHEAGTGIHFFCVSYKLAANYQHRLRNIILTFYISVLPVGEQCQKRNTPGRAGPSGIPHAVIFSLKIYIFPFFCSCLL